LKWLWKCADQYDQLLAVAADLVRRKAAVIYASGNTNSAIAAKAAATTMPIVCRRVLVALGFVLGLAVILPAQDTKL
jgi:hypothetical protein